MVGEAILVIVQSGTYFVPELMAQRPDELWHAWQVLTAAGSVEAARDAARGLSLAAQHAVIPLLMSVVDAFERGQQVSFVDMTFSLPDWLVELCRDSPWPTADSAPRVTQSAG